MAELEAPFYYKTDYTVYPYCDYRILERAASQQHQKMGFKDWKDLVGVPIFASEISYSIGEGSNETHYKGDLRAMYDITIPYQFTKLILHDASRYDVEKSGCIEEIIGNIFCNILRKKKAMLEYRNQELQNKLITLTV